MEFEKYFYISEEVNHALAHNMPVVALESTIISHGFNYPENLECARQCEAIIRSEGAIPATIGIIAGKVIIGLSDEEIVYLAQTPNIPKCSRRDIAALIAKGSDGATTVSSTMIFAAMVGIKVFATGGIGGVHKHGEVTMDISADLEELARTNIAVVCSGAKSILDIGRTLEYLETHGVSVLGYQTSAFPDFYTRDSGKKVDYRVASTDEIANILNVKDALGIESGTLIANPIPKHHALESVFITQLIDDVVKKADAEGIRGNRVTPYILDALHYVSDGKSVLANKALVYNNALVASKLAVSLAN